jgi:hypothetical protein
VQLLGGQVVVDDGLVRRRRADQQGAGAELLEDVELALGPAQAGSQPARRDRLEVTERLVDVDGQAAPAYSCRIRAGDQADAIRSLSKISIPSNPAAATAAGLSSRADTRRPGRPGLRGLPTN